MFEISIELEDSQFAISGLGGTALLLEPFASTLVAVGGAADGLITVISPDPQASEVTVGFVSLESGPQGPQDGLRWTEFSVHSEAGLLVGDLDGENCAVLTLRGGWTRVRIQARPAGTSPNFTVTCWPAHEQTASHGGGTSRTDDRSHVDTSGSTSPAASLKDLAAQGQAAGARVGTGLWDPINDLAGSAISRTMVRVPQRSAFRRLASPGFWLPGSGFSELTVGTPFYLRVQSHNAHRDPGLTTAGSYIEFVFRSLEPPDLAVMDWNWFVGPEPHTFVRDSEGRPVLDPPSRLSLAFSSVPGEPETAVTLTHAGVPRAWADYLQAFWDWQLTELALVLAS